MLNINDRDLIIDALKDVAKHSLLQIELDKKFNYVSFDLNSIISHRLEQSVANHLKKRFNVEHQGGPGKPDVLFLDTEEHLDIKVTSTNGKKTVKFQQDVTTWPEEEKKNILRFIRNENDINEWCVLLYFSSRDDFKNASLKSRGKAEMKSQKKFDCIKIIGNLDRGKRGGVKIIFENIGIKNEDWNNCWIDEATSQRTLGSNHDGFKRMQHGRAFYIVIFSWIDRWKRYFKYLEKVLNSKIA